MSVKCSKLKSVIFLLCCFMCVGAEATLPKAVKIFFSTSALAIAAKVVRIGAYTGNSNQNSKGKILNKKSFIEEETGLPLEGVLGLST